MKSFANAAIISEKLATAFASFADEIAEADADSEEFAETFAELGEACEDLAEGLAHVATSLNEGNKSGAVPAIFNESMEFLLDAVDVFEILSEQDEEEMDDEDEDEEEEDEGND